jgi:hypothetical protein
MFGRTIGPGEGANVSIITMDFWSTRIAIRNNVVQPTTYDPPYQMSKAMRHLSLLVRIGSTIMNNTSEGAMIRQPSDGRR